MGGALDPKVAAWKREATDDPEGFWARAAEQLPWFRKWESVLDWEPPTFRWYSGGRTNLAYNCVDHQVIVGVHIRVMDAGVVKVVILNGIET